MNIDPSLYDKYGKDKVDAAVAYLTYKNVEPLPKAEIPGVPTLYVFRHGQTTDNADMVFSGWRDVDLTEAGVEQANVLAEKLKEKEIHLLIASDLIRAVKTMAIAMSKNEYAKNLEINKDARIKERNYGELQGKSKLQLQLENPSLAHDYRRSYSVTPPGGESLANVVHRVKPFIEEISEQMKEHNINVAVSCHGNSIRAIRQYFEGLSNDETAVIETPLGQDYAAYPIK